MAPKQKAFAYATPLAQRLDRRTFARAAGVGLIAAPFVRLLLSEPAAAAPGSAKRFFVMVTAATKVDSWECVGSSDNELITNDWNDGLDRVKDKIVVVEGLQGKELGHGNKGELRMTLNKHKGVTIDRIVMDHLAATGVSTAIPALHLGVDVDENQSSFRNSGSVPTVNSPSAATELVFGNFNPSSTLSEEEVAAALAKKKSILDAVRTDLNRLHGMLGVEERPKLDAHLDSLRQYEQRLTSSGPAVEGCEPPMVMDSTDSITNIQSHMALAQATLRCDISRVVGVLWGQHNRLDIQMPDLGISNDIHHLQHNTGNADKLEQYRKYESWSSHQFADFVEGLAGAPDPETGGSLLDTTIVCWARHMGDGRTHSMNNVRLVFAGGPDILRLAPDGRYMHMNNAGTNRDALSSIAHAMGQTDPAAVEDHTPIDGILA